MEVQPADRAKTAFITSEGLYEFNVLPFGLCNGPVVYRTSILYRMRMVHTVRVYAYGHSVRYDRTRMVWLFVPYAYSYYATIVVHKQHKYIAIVNTVLLFVLDHELYARCSFLQ